MVGDFTGFASGPSNWSSGWSNTTVARAAGWHHFKISVGPAKGDGTNDVSYFIDNMTTPVATKSTTTVGGINSMSIFSKCNVTAGTAATSGYFDEIQFGKAGTESIDNWNVIGHYAETVAATRWATDYFAAGTEGATEATMAAKTGASYNGKLWKVANSGLLDINRVYSAVYSAFTAPAAPAYTENGVSYLFTYINNGGAAITDALLSCGSDDGIKILLNGTEIYSHDVARGLTPDQDYSTPFTIPAGISRLLVKITQGSSAYGAQVRITHADGSALSNVTYVASDDVAPAGTISINAGAATTTSTSVTLTLTASDAMSGVAKVQFSDNGTDYGTPVAFAATMPYTLTSGDGVKTVYVKFIDAAGNVSTAVSDDITLASGPTPPPACTEKTKISDFWAVANDATVYGLDNASAKTVTAVWPDGTFWIEETNRSAAIRVVPTAGVYKYFDDGAKSAIQAGDVVDVYGNLSVTAGYDRVFNASYVRDRTIGTGTGIKPTGTTQRFLMGNKPIVSPSNTYTPAMAIAGQNKGLYNAGMFIKLAGNVVVGAGGTGFFFLDDKTDTTRTQGIKVFFNGTIPTSGSKVVTGVVGMAGGVPVIYATNVAP